MYEGLKQFTPPLAAIGVLLGGWQLSSTLHFVNPHLLPSPTSVSLQLWNMIADASLLSPVVSTLCLLLIGYGIGCAFGIVFGLAMGLNQTIFYLFEPLVELLRTVPKPAILPPLILFLGLGVTSKITIVSLAVFFPVLISTLQAVTSVDRTLIDTARTFGKRPGRIVLRIFLPSAAPMIATGMRIGLGLALVLEILAEMLLDGQTGIGFQILDAERSFKVTQMYAWIVVLSAMGISLNWCFIILERASLPWRGK
jgi:ABC-type nitrate/sulfonate/bicarbonate transport system permease component